MTCVSKIISQRPRQHSALQPIPNFVFKAFSNLYLCDCFRYNRVFLSHFRDPIQVPRIENRVPTIRENHHRVPRIKENRVPIIREIGSLQVHIRYLTFFLKNPGYTMLISEPQWLSWQFHQKNMNFTPNGFCDFLMFISVSLMSFY